jgi:hypothetical protein
VLTSNTKTNCKTSILTNKTNAHTYPVGTGGPTVFKREESYLELKKYEYLKKVAVLGTSDSVRMAITTAVSYTRNSNGYGERN